MGLGYDTVINIRNRRRASAIPSSFALQNLHLPRRGTPVSRGTSESSGYRRSFDSGMDNGYDADAEVYGLQYSVETSPQDDNVSISTDSGYNLHNFANVPSAPPLDVLDHVSQVARSETVSGASSYSEINGVIANLSGTPDRSVRTASVSSYLVSACFPTYHASELGSWYGVISYEACVRLCIDACARGCKEAPFFLVNKCAVLRNSFSMKHVLLPSEEELMSRSPELISEAAAVRTKKSLGKCGSVAETVAYDFVLETAMKAQQFQKRKLRLHGPWKWLITEFSKYYGVSEAHTNLRYISYIMDVATPTADCLDLNRILSEVSEKIEQIIAFVFENYKSLDESSPSGVTDVLKPASGSAAPALASALRLYNLLNDILSPQAQLKLCKYFQIAARKRCDIYLAETDDYVSNNNERLSIDSQALPTAYQKMQILCLNLKNEIFTDIQIHNLQILPSFLDLPKISSFIYSTKLSTRIQTFLFWCPQTGPLLPVMEIAIATADYQRDLLTWNIKPVKGGVDAKELFRSYLCSWILGKRDLLLDLCKPDKDNCISDNLDTAFQRNCIARYLHNRSVKSDQRQQPATPFVEDIYNKLKETLNECEVILKLWPVYVCCGPEVVGKAVVDTLENLYANVLSPLKQKSMPVKLGLKYVHKFAKGGASFYTVPKELGIALNSMERMLNVLQPEIEVQMSRNSCIASNGNDVNGEYVSEITVMLRAKLRTYLQVVTEKLVQNTKLQNTTNLKKILQNPKEGDPDSVVRNKMQPLKELLEKMIDQLQVVFDEQFPLRLHSCKCYSIRSTTSDDNSSGTNRFQNTKPDKFEHFEDRQPYEVHEFGKTIPNETPEDEPGSVVHDEARLGEAYEEGLELDLKTKVAEFVDKLNLKFDSDDSYSIALYGSSAVAALYLASAVIGAIDSIPVLPKMMEVVGLGYTVWFASRYLVFKKNRDELAAKIEEIKQQVLGSEDE
ncbi:hypothetical protein Leryth_015185 [Lithospermum erythrorhizon]|nr:hypothetical protein Leryth_015185 [Lithospermum erythrorhizon]